MGARGALQLELRWTAGTSGSSAALSPSPPHWLRVPSFWLRWSPRSRARPRYCFPDARILNLGQTRSLQAGITYCKAFWLELVRAVSPPSRLQHLPLCLAPDPTIYRTAARIAFPFHGFDQATSPPWKTKVSPSGLVCQISISNHGALRFLPWPPILPAGPVVFSQYKRSAEGDVKLYSAPTPLVIPQVFIERL